MPRHLYRDCFYFFLSIVALNLSVPENYDGRLHMQNHVDYSI